MKLISIPSDAVRDVWPLVRPYFDAACKRGLGDISPDTLRDECISGHGRLLAIEDRLALVAAAVARICVQADGTRACELVACGGGSLAAWRHVIPEFEDWARFHGSKSVRLSGRPGWERVFRGYVRKPYVTLVKEL